MNEARLTLEDKINDLAGNFAESVSDLESGTFVREGVLKEAVTAVIWAMYREMPDQRSALADVLDDWPAIIKEATRNDAANPSSAPAP